MFHKEILYRLSLDRNRFGVTFIVQPDKPNLKFVVTFCWWHNIKYLQMKTNGIFPKRQKNLRFFFVLYSVIDKEFSGLMGWE